jgi:hypothetical protein
LDGSRAGNSVIHHAAASVSGVICLQGGAVAEARQAASQLIEIVGAHDFVVSNIGTASHDEEIVSCSPCVRPREIVINQERFKKCQTGMFDLYGFLGQDP